MKLMFPPQHWKAMLPLVLGEFIPSALEGGKANEKWLGVPKHLWPKIIRDAHKHFWDEAAETGDTATFMGRLTDTQQRSLITAIKRDAAFLPALMSHTLSPFEQMQDFLSKAMQSATTILNLPNQQMGELDNKLVASKVKLQSQIRALGEITIKLQSAYREELDVSDWNTPQIAPSQPKAQITQRPPRPLPVEAVVVDTRPKTVEEEAIAAGFAAPTQKTPPKSSQDALRTPSDTPQAQTPYSPLQAAGFDAPVEEPPPPSRKMPTDLMSRNEEE